MRSLAACSCFLLMGSHEIRVAPSDPFHQNHLALGGFETQGFRATVFLGVVPALGLFEARKFEDNHTFGLPIAFKGLRGSTPYHEAAAILLHRRRHELTILIKSGRIGNFNIDNEVCWHAVPFAFSSSDPRPPE